MIKVTTNDIRKFIQDLELDIKVDNLDNEKRLRDQGVDSLDLMSILLNLEEFYKVKISDEAIEAGEFESINSIVKTLNELLTSPST